jgi:hypothetical protein
MKSSNYKIPLCAIFFVLLLFRHSLVQIFALLPLSEQIQNFEC